MERVLRWLLAAIFLWAAYTKLRQPWLVFAMSIDTYQLLPESAVLFVARTLPWVELAIGLLLAAGGGLRYVAAAATALLGLFLGVMLHADGKGLGIDCGCFGVGEALSAKTLARDSGLVLCSIALTALAFRTHRARTEASR